MGDGVGIRDMVYQAHNSLLGDVYVEDIASDDNTILRQTFCGASVEPIATARIIASKSGYYTWH